MRKFITKISLFFFFMLIVNFLYLKVIQKIEWNFKKAQKIYEFKNHHADIIILGNSLALDAVDAKVLEQENIDTYNLALPGANLETNALQLEKYLQVNQSPRKVILGLSSVTNEEINRKGIIPIVDHYYGKRKFSYRELPMIKFKWLANEVIKRIVSKDHREATVYNGQFRTNKIIVDQSTYQASMQNIFDTLRYEQATFLNKIDSICLEHSIQLISIELPGSKENQDAIPIGPHRVQGNHGRQLEIYNFNNFEFAKILNPRTDWLTKSHLNVNGSATFTNAVTHQGLFD